MGERPLRLLLGFDYGTKQIGVAVGQAITGQARELCVLKAQNGVPDWQKVEALIKEWQPDAIVVGLPLNMDGTEGERAAKSRKLAKTVELWSGLPVRMWDERQTTCAAADILDESGTFGTKRKEILDSVSATVILDDYLAWRKEHPGEI